MTKILILGGKGMAGHVMYEYLRRQQEYDVRFTSRDKTDKSSIYLDVTDTPALENLLASENPDIVINCTGILNAAAEQNPLLAFRVNSLLPHQLAAFMERQQGRLIQISTDCVFSGEKGRYTESDFRDGTSVYAQSKQLGEITNAPHLTIRTSIIGPELKDDGIGLFHWFMNQSGEIKGFKRVFWNGVTTLELAKATHFFIQQKTSGLYHLCPSDTISKLDLLQLFKSVYEKDDVQITPDAGPVLDRTIVNTRISPAYAVPSFHEMLEEQKKFYPLLLS
ncbi:dTDP-4-dehydrorhamnose reductase family protein [Terribacillus saccharophilus]|uniref:dTDP-4-dehydrorhamnose reductase family protein n=1 Tax=Terribacillus saccharophilus TaxID=361277 RepID=UPI002DD272CF|nr:SDR family oxidoreductase [Terribacillus saccharophilus]MEC0291515.1 SDR family oxidoreductase [Terribacillus saccharophilus]